MKLFEVSADAIHLGDSRKTAELRSDDPILNGAQLRRGDRFIRGFSRFLNGFHRPHENLAQTSGDGPHDRFQSGGNLPLGFLNAVAYQLPRKVYVGVVLKDDRHLGKPVSGKGARMA